jgi:hypothetical protein
VAGGKTFRPPPWRFGRRNGGFGGWNGRSGGWNGRFGGWNSRFGRQNERLHEFAGVFFHDLGDPSNAASMQVELARDDLGDSEHLDRLDEVHDRMDSTSRTTVPATHPGNARPCSSTGTRTTPTASASG